MQDFEIILHRVEWATLLFFAALFVLMEVAVFFFTFFTAAKSEFSEVRPSCKVAFFFFLLVELFIVVFPQMDRS